jgi:hypothetical protein
LVVHFTLVIFHKLKRNKKLTETFREVLEVEQREKFRLALARERNEGLLIVVDGRKLNYE